MKFSRTGGKKALFVGWCLILSVFSLIAIIWAGTFLPGFIGGAFRSIAGLLGTPLIMEGSFCLIAFFIVLSLNSYRRQKEGDEYVTMEISSPEGGVNESEKTSEG